MATEQQTENAPVETVEEKRAEGDGKPGDTLSITDNRTVSNTTSRSPTGRCGRWTCARSRCPTTTSG
jgi:hypothetical protein